jgi:hypothetical protein
MLQASSEPDLAKKALDPDRTGNLGPKHFDGYCAVVFLVLCEVDRRHPPAAELALDRVAVAEGSFQTSEQVGQAMARWRGTAPS